MCEVINLIEILGPSNFCCFFIGSVSVKDGFEVLAILNFLEGLEGQANFFDCVWDIVDVEATFLVLYIS